jgi:thiol-disulfide isomerase/thioredoxin
MTSQQLFDDPTLRRVLDSRPPVSPDALSPTGPEAHTVLDRVLSTSQATSSAAEGLPLPWRPRRPIAVPFIAQPGVMGARSVGRPGRSRCSDSHCGSPTHGRRRLVDRHARVRGHQPCRRHRALRREHPGARSGWQIEDNDNHGADAGQLLRSNPAALHALLHRVRGHPVVINEWASWCDNCRAEAAAFQTASVTFGKRVAFLGVDVADNTKSAKQFLKAFLPAYPNYTDPHQAIARSLEASGYYPQTLFTTLAASRSSITEAATQAPRLSSTTFSDTPSAETTQTSAQPYRRMSQ